MKKTTKIKLSTLKINPKNPRFIKDEKFVKLCKSIKDFPKMLELRPIIVDKNNMILGGNMRYRALKENGYTEVPAEWVKSTSGMTDAQIREFVVKDNIGFGEWDFDILANDYDMQELLDMGFDEKELDIHTDNNNLGNQNLYDDPMQLHTEKEYILIICDDVLDFDRVRELFKMGFVSTNNGAKNVIVKSRTLRAKELLNENSDSEQK